MVEILGSITGYIPIISMLFFALVFVIIIWVGLYFILIVRKRKKWKIEVHEQKADGKLHTVGYDILEEKKLNWGTKTIYWLKRAKQECIPPPQGVTDRFKGKEECDYIRIEREMIPTTRKLDVNYNNPEVKSKVTKVYDSMLKKIRSIKTTFKDSDAVRDRFIYIPVEKTLRATYHYEPVPYDMNMMAINEIHNADEFFASKFEFWKKYGAVIVFGLTIVFLIILIVLTFDWLSTSMEQITAGLATIAESFQTSGVTEAAPPS
jgi:energy-coupling factor transporter transmembrane protein EcfT